MKHKILEQYAKCEGCLYEIQECYNYQKNGFNSGLEFSKNGGHVFFFVVDDKGRLVVW